MLEERKTSVKRLEPRRQSFRMGTDKAVELRYLPTLIKLLVVEEEDSRIVPVVVRKDRL